MRIAPEWLSLIATVGIAVYKWLDGKRQQKKSAIRAGMALRLEVSVSWASRNACPRPLEGGDTAADTPPLERTRRIQRAG
jgi:hypothetical protein